MNDYDSGVGNPVRFVVFLLGCALLSVPCVIGMMAEGALVRLAEWADK
jgi:hypothetical protein